MKYSYQIGDLVHIPQCVDLINCARGSRPQLTIPLSIEQTTRPQLGVIIDPSNGGGYVRIYCGGEEWAVKDSSVYKIEA